MMSKTQLFLRPKGATGLDAIDWFLRDEFTTTRAAGSVDGTAAEPGPGTRATTNDVAAISGGNWNCTNAAANLFYSDKNVVAQNGTVLAGRASNTNNTAIFGFCRNPLFPQNSTIGLAFTSSVGNTTLNLRGNLAIIISDLYQAYTSTDIKYFAVVQYGGDILYLLILDDVWKLLYRYSGFGNAAMYPSVGRSGNITTALDFYRIPEGLYFFTDAIYDSFARADGALGSTETTGKEGQTITAKSWASAVGTFEVSSNKAQPTVLDGGLAVAIIVADSSDVYVEAALTRNGGNVGVVLRWSDENNHIKAYHDGTNVIMEEVVSGVPNTLITAAVAYSAGAEIKARVNGRTGYLFYNNTDVGSTTIIDATLIATGNGIYATDTLNTIDNYHLLPYSADGYESEFNTLAGVPGTILPDTESVFQGTSIMYGSIASSIEQTSFRGLVKNYFGLSRNFTRTGSDTWYALALLDDVFIYTYKLIFIDFYNDSNSAIGNASREAWIRRVWTHMPNCNVLGVLWPKISSPDGTFVDPETANADWKTFCDYYGIPYLDVHTALYNEVVIGGTPLTDFYDAGAYTHPTDGGHLFAYNLVQPQLNDLLNGTRQFGEGSTLPARMTALSDEFDNSPTVAINGKDYDSITGSWTVGVGGYIESSDVGATITFSGTFASFAIDDVSNGFPEVEIDIDGGGYAVEDEPRRATYCGNYGAHTITYRVLTTFRIDVFFGV